MPTRRRFVISTSSAFLALAAAPQNLLAQGVGGDVFASGYLGAYLQGQLTQTRFETVVGSTFRLFHQDGSVSNLKLLQVSATPTQSRTSTQVSGRMLSATVAPASQAESFYAAFASDAGLTQGSYVLDHGTLGRFSAFLVPGTSSAGVTCTATFNYLAMPALQKPAPVRAPIALGRSPL